MVEKINDNTEEKLKNSDEILSEEINDNSKLNKTVEEEKKQDIIESKEIEKNLKIDKKEDKKEGNKKEIEKVEMVEISKTRLEELETVEARALEEVKRERASGINYRKRLEKQRDEFAEIASVRVLKKLLNVKDDIKRILENGKHVIPKDHYEGIELLSQRVEAIFEQENVTLIKIKEGKTLYDPYKHEAIMARPMENMNPNIVLTQVSAGFVKGDRVLRAAKVIISTKPPKPKDEEKIEEVDQKETKQDQDKITSQEDKSIDKKKEDTITTHEEKSENITE